MTTVHAPGSREECTSRTTLGEVIESTVRRSPSPWRQLTKHSKANVIYLHPLHKSWLRQNQTELVTLDPTTTPLLSHSLDNTIITRSHRCRRRRLFLCIGHFDYPLCTMYVPPPPPAMHTRMIIIRILIVSTPASTTPPRAPTNKTYVNTGTEGAQLLYWCTGVHAWMNGCCWANSLLTKRSHSPAALDWD